MKFTRTDHGVRPNLVIHHIDGDPRNNDPSNLVIMEHETNPRRRETISPEQFTDAHRNEVCAIGQGHDCCRYLTMGPSGWGCEKHSGLKALLDRRVAAAEMTARGDNCGGIEWEDGR